MSRSSGFPDSFRRSRIPAARLGMMNLIALAPTQNETVAALEKQIREISEGIGSENDFIASFKRTGNISELTRPLLTQLVEKILIHEGGKITIRLKCRDAFEQVIEYIEMNKETVKTA